VNGYFGWVGGDGGDESGERNERVLSCADEGGFLDL